MKQDLFQRFQRWLIAAIAIGALIYLGGSVWAGFSKMKDQFQIFQWSMFVYAILLTLSNYTLRFFKWHYLLGRLNVQMPLVEDMWTFTAGLSMAISPGKAGELLKPYVVRARTGVPMATTIPALITERLTDGIALLILTATGITTFAADQTIWLIGLALCILAGLAILASERLSLGLLHSIGKIGPLSKIVPKLIEMMQSMRTCVAPISLVWTIFLSVIAWGAECIAFYVIFKGLGVEASWQLCCFLYSAATLAGSVFFGGVGVADGALAGGALKLIKLTSSQAFTAAFLVRIATLWLGVGLGAIALFKVSNMLGGRVDLDEDPNAHPANSSDAPNPTTQELQ